MSTELADIKQWYALRDNAAALDFLDRHAVLVPTLQEAYGEIRTYFPLSEIHLEVVSDYDAQDRDDSERLVAFIVTSLEPSQAVARLNEFYLAWWFGVTDQARKWLSFSLECA